MEKETEYLESRDTGAPDTMRRDWVGGLIVLGVVFGVAFFGSLLLSGCTALGLKQPAPAWVAADRATYDVVAPAFKVYVQADPVLGLQDKASLIDLLADWEFRLREAEKAVAVPK